MYKRRGIWFNFSEGEYSSSFHFFMPKRMGRMLSPDDLRVGQATIVPESSRKEQDPWPMDGNDPMLQAQLLAEYNRREAATREAAARAAVERVLSKKQSEKPKDGAIKKPPIRAPVSHKTSVDARESARKINLERIKNELASMRDAFNKAQFGVTLLEDGTIQEMSGIAPVARRLFSRGKYEALLEKYRSLLLKKMDLEEGQTVA